MTNENGVAPKAEGEAEQRFEWPDGPKAMAERAAPVAQAVVGAVPDTYSITFHDPRDFCRFASILIGAAYSSERDALKRFQDGSLFGEGTWGKVSASTTPRPEASAPKADDMPGMWEPADVSGGETDCREATAVATKEKS